MMELEPILEEAEKHVASSSQKERLTLFYATISSAIDLPESNFAQQAGTLTTLIFRTLPIYEDRSSAAAVEHIIRKAIARDPAFVKFFTGTLVQTAMKTGKTAPIATRLKLLRWSIILLRANPDLLKVKAAFSRLVEVQAVLLTGVLQGPWRVRRSVMHAFHQLLHQVNPAFAQYMVEIQGLLLTFDNIGLLFPLLEYCTSPTVPKDLFKNEKAIFIDIYLKLVLSSRDRPPKFVYALFDPLLKRLSHEDFADRIVPTVTKMLKRNPELVMGAAGHLVDVVELDMSRYVGDFTSTLLQQARHSEENKRKEALKVLRSLAKQSSDLDAVAGMYRSVKEILAGSEGKLTFSYQRLGMMMAIQDLAAAPSGRAAMDLAQEISTFLIGAYKDELTEEVKVAIYGALGAWLARVGEAAPKGVANFFVAALKEKETLRRAALRCLRHSFRNPDVRGQLLPLVEPLIAMVKSALSKATQRLEGVYALLLVASIGVVDLATEDKLIHEKVWTSVVTKDSPLFSSSMVVKLAADDVSALVELLEVLLLQHSARISNNAEAWSGVYQLIVSLLWYPSLDVRKAAASVVARCHSISSGLSSSFLDASVAWLPALEDRQEALQISEASESSGEPATLSMPSSDLVGKALLQVVAPDLAEKAGVAARLLLAAHHPCIVPGQRKNVVWKELVKVSAKRGVDVEATLASDAAIVCKILLGPGGLMSPRKPQAKAAISAIATVMQTFPTEFFPHLLMALQLLGARTAHDALTDRDIKIYYTCEGVLSSEDGMYIAEVVKDRNVRQARGRMKMYGDDDEELAPAAPKAAPQLRPSQVKNIAVGKKDTSKPGKKSDVDKGKTAKEEAREEKLKEESARRAELQVMKNRITLVLEALGAAAVANRSFAHDQLPALVEFVLPLLNSKLLSSEAYTAMLQLSTCVAPPLQPLGADLATAICIVASSEHAVLLNLRTKHGEEKGQRGERQQQGMVERVVAGMVAACKQGPLPAASFGAVFPIIEAILLSPQKTKVHDVLIDVLSLHTSTYITLPRERMIKVLYHALGCVPIYAERVGPLLRELCQGLRPNELAQALSGLYANQTHVRAACLDAIKFVPALAAGAAPPTPEVSAALWMAQYDPDEENVDAAEEVWDLYSHELGLDYAPALMASLGHKHLNVRQAAAEALAAAMDEYRSTIQETLSSMFSLYIRCSQTLEGVDEGWPAREGVALTLRAAADVLGARDLPVVATFLISRALADFNPDVRARMVEAGAAIIERHGKDNVGLFLPIFENYLDKKSADEERYDLVREGVVVFMGALAQHFSHDDAKVGSILGRLLEVLNTPSESVQRAVSNCLPPLMASQGTNVHKLVQQLLYTLMNSDRYGERRGAAFGIAGVVKGLGISSLKECGIMDALKTGVEDKNSPKAREGALFAFECLSEKLGRLFEPYAIHILPLLLVCFGDGVMAVREATEGASRTIMGQLTGHGVKLVLPAMLRGLSDRAWRTKQGSVQLLGAMAFCAPKQLSQCLPTIVPQLSQVLTDTHPKVQSAAQTALQQVGSVILNPEIAALVPTLLIGIADPNSHTKSSLDMLLQTTFVNSVDAASLALLVPIVHRGLRERSAEVKKKAAQITGNMCSLATNHRDMLPYLHLLLPELKKVLVDPHPEVRTVAARALGSLVKGMGEDNFRELIPWLLSTLKSDTSSVERSGAAQGLSEVVAALGKAHLEALLPEIISNCSHQRASVRDGYLTLFKYLPTSLGSQFQKYLTRVLPAIIDGLADENESVRDAALAAGHIFVEHYASTSLPLLLPAVEEGIFNDNWRIRQSSVELLGDLLFKVAGTTGKVVIDGGSDDEGASTEAHGRAIVEVLGTEKRNEVLAAVYMVRSDVTPSVRQAALHVWKTVVANTPKTLREIMPVLMKTLIASLASTSSERRQVAGRSLGELVRKLGDRVLPSIIPILARGLEEDSLSTRQGVCIGLSEVMASAGKQQLAAYMEELISTIRNALCDSEPEVREAAGQAFSTLYKSAGMQAVDEIVPALLLALEDKSKAATGLDGLKQILSVRTAAVLPQILPRLVTPLITVFNAQALGALAEVAGSGLNVHLSLLLPPLVTAMGSDASTELAEATRNAAQTVVMALDEDGLDALLEELVQGLQDPLAATRKGSAQLLGFFCRSTRLDMEDEVASLLTTLILMLTDTDEHVCKAAWEALVSVTGMVPKESLVQHLRTVRDAISTARDKERRKRKGQPIVIPGLCLPKALQPLLPVFLQGLMSGSAELREQAADGLGELIDVTSESALRPFVVSITGPLIRIIGDRFPWQVKSAILSTLSILITKGGIALKPFLPQLQTTFMKCLQDNTRMVRSRAAKALGRLTGLNPRVDPLVTDILTGIQGASGGVKEAIVGALKGVLQHAGKSVSAPVLGRVCASLSDILGAEEDELRRLVARSLGIVSQYLGEEEFEGLVMSLTQLEDGVAWTQRHGVIQALASLIRHSAARLCLTPGLLSSVVSSLKVQAKDDKVPVRENVAKASGRLFCHLLSESSSGDQFHGELLSLLGMLLADDSSDVRRRALSAVKGVVKVKTGTLSQFFPVLAPRVAECLKDSSQPVRLAAERTALHLFQLTKSPENVQAAQKFITGLDARRISKYPDVSDASDDSEQEGED